MVGMSRRWMHIRRSMSQRGVVVGSRTQIGRRIHEEWSKKLYCSTSTSLEQDKINHEYAARGPLFNEHKKHKAESNLPKVEPKVE